MSEYETITEDEIEEWCRGTISHNGMQYLKDILIGEYPLETAREDILSFRTTNNEK